MNPVLLLGLVAAGLTGGVVGWGRLRDVPVPQVGSWIADPVLWADPQVDAAELDQALRWWAKRGCTFERTRYPGTATITLVVDPTLEDVARTSVQQSVDRVVVSAEVRLRPHADALAIAHDLGHALGYLHPIAPPSGHILHPWAAGWDGRGLGSCARADPTRARARATRPRVGGPTVPR